MIGGFKKTSIRGRRDLLALTPAIDRFLFALIQQNELVVPGAVALQVVCGLGGQAGHHLLVDAHLTLRANTPTRSQHS